MDTGKCVHCGSYSFILLSNDVQFGQAYVSVGNVTGRVVTVLEFQT